MHNSCTVFRAEGLKQECATPSMWIGVVQFLGHGTMCQAELNMERLREVTAEYARFDGDTGSSEVQGT